MQGWTDLGRDAKSSIMSGEKIQFRSKLIIVLLYVIYQVSFFRLKIIRLFSKILKIGIIDLKEVITYKFYKITFLFISFHYYKLYVEYVFVDEIDLVNVPFILVVVANEIHN